MSDPLAYFLTWTCYGTWLHGDSRGSVDDAHNTPDTPYIEPQTKHVDYEKSILIHTPVKLSSAAQIVVETTIIKHCDIRSWHLHAINVRTNHVHVIVTAFDIEPETVLKQFKSWCTRNLRDEGLFKQEIRIWTHHGSTRYLWNEKSLYQTIDYVMEFQ